VINLKGTSKIFNSLLITLISCTSTKRIKDGTISDKIYQPKQTYLIDNRHYIDEEDHIIEYKINVNHKMKRFYAYVSKETYDSLKIDDIFDRDKFAYSEHDDIREMPDNNHNLVITENKP